MWGVWGGGAWQETQYCVEDPGGIASPWPGGAVKWFQQEGLWLGRVGVARAVSHVHTPMLAVRGNGVDHMHGEHGKLSP